MKAIGIQTSLPTEAEDCFIEFETPKPVPLDRDLLVKVFAVSVNPVDYKVRQNSAIDQVLDEPKILGWDAVGEVEACGSDCVLFKPGDRVYYAGDITRAGSNAEFQLVDERIVALAPKKLSDAETAAMPLTTLTAWETLFDRIRVVPAKDKGKTVLIIAGAGGVGSIAIQLAKQVADLRILASASRPETAEWCKKFGADHIVNHYHLINEVRKAGFDHVDYILDFVSTNQYWQDMVELIKPQGHIASITGSSEPVVLNLLKTKSVSFHWEFMYTRPMFQTDDMIEQHNILSDAARMLDEGILQTTLKQTLKGMTVENFREAHAILESGKMIGKLVIEY